eukprot:760655-Prorocentrum_lima.AAC.1
MQTLLWVGETGWPQLVLLFWNKHWQLLPLHAPGAGDGEASNGHGALIVVSQDPCPGMIAPNGLRGAGPTTTPAQDTMGGQGQATCGMGDRQLPQDGRGPLQQQPTENDAAVVFQNLLRIGT